MLEEKLKNLVAGEIDTSEETRDFYSHDASLFELVPEVVVFPKDSSDIKSIVKYVADNKKGNPGLSITPRSAGTDMSGGAIGESIVLDFTKHFNQIHEVTADSARLQPGVYFRDLDKKMVELGCMFPPYPASRDLCTVGGIVSNNSGGEKSLEYGKTANFINELKVVLADGNEYVIKPLNKAELDKKMSQDDFEGKLYKKVFKLVDDNYDEIKAAKPGVSKDATGYHLWDIWDRETGIFDITKAVVGAQGTLGLITDINFKLVPRPKHSGVLVCFFKDISKLGDVVNTVLEQKPATFEAFDDNTLWMSFKFFPAFIKRLGLKRWILLALQLIPDFFMLFRGIPKLIVMIEFTGDSVDEVKEKITKMRKILEPDYKIAMEENETEFKAQKFWIMRRESFNLLRQKVKEKHTAPFIDDMVIPPKHLPDAWPKLRAIVKKYNLLATITGHIGDGNFHIIPLMNIETPKGVNYVPATTLKERFKLVPAMQEVNKLVLSYGGSLSGEHNDGMIRGPWLEQMYGPTVLGYMRELKDAFDPQNIFNPHKKVTSDWEFSMEHMREKY